MIKIILLVNVTIIFWLLPLNAESNSGFTVLWPIDGDYVCYGQIVTYKCTLCGGVATVWRGTAFQCVNAANMISLPHFGFASNRGECNGGEIVAFGVLSANGCYTSHANITMSRDVEGREVQCALDDGRIQTSTLIMIGNSTIPTIERPPAPTEVRVNTTITSGQGHLVFWWDEVEGIDHYIVNATNCGVCPNVTILPTARCTNIEANGKRCEFSIHSVICEMVSNASDLVSFALNAPVLHIISAIPCYSYPGGDLISVLSSFIQSNPLQVSEGSNVSYLPAVYSIMYSHSHSDSTSGDHCYSMNVESSSPLCTSGTCTHVFNISSSTCSPSVDLRLIVFARNLIGSKSLTGPQLHGTNKLVRIHFSPSNSYIYCTFINHQNSMKVCSVEIYKLNDGGFNKCDVEAAQGTTKLKSVNSSTTDTVTIETSLINQFSERLCFTVVASDSTRQVVVKGILNITGSDLGNSEGEKLQLPLVVSVSLVALLLIVGFSFGILIVILSVSTRAKTKAIRHLESEVLRANNENVTYEQIDVAHQSVQNQATIICTSENIAYEHIKIRQS